jgi:hypothetical protein
MVAAEARAKTVPMRASTITRRRQPLSAASVTRPTMVTANGAREGEQALALDAVLVAPDQLE